MLVELEHRFQAQVHCDDTTVILPLSGIVDTSNTFILYKHASGAKLNEGKTVTFSSIHISTCSFKQSTQLERYFWLLHLLERYS